MVFPVVMYRCESWMLKKAEHRRIDTFELWCWRRLFRVPWTSRRSNQSIQKEISLEYSLEGLMLKLQYFGHLMQRADSFEKILMLGKIEGRRRRGYWGWDYWMPSRTQWTWVWASSGSWWWTGKPGELQSMGSQRVAYDWATELNWTYYYLCSWSWGFPGGFRSKESTCQCRGHGFNPCIRKILWRRKWQPIPVFLPWKSHGQRSLVGYSSWDCTVRHNLVTEQQ